MSSPQAGWYQDPQNPQGQRYWDGTQWTNQTQQATPPPPPPPGSYQAPTFQVPGVPSYQGYGTPQQGSYAAQPVSFPEAVKRLCTKWTTRGRASRSEYWFAALAIFLFNITSNLVSGVSGSAAVSSVTGLVQLVAGVSLLLVAARRYHDTGRSGGWVLLHAALHTVLAITLLGMLVGVAFSALGGSESDIESFGVGAIVVAFLLLASIVWSVIWLSLPGKPEKNRFDA